MTRPESVGPTSAVRILVITNMPPTLAHLGGGPQRTELLLRALETCGDVALLIVRQPALCTREQLEPLRGRYDLVDELTWDPSYWAGPWRWVAGRPPQVWWQTATELAIQSGRYRTDPQVAATVSRHLQSTPYDLIVGRHLLPLLRSGVFDVATPPLLLDVDDLDFDVLRQQRAAARPRDRGASWSDMLCVRHLRGITLRALRRCAHVWFTNEDDRRVAAVQHSSVLPNIPWTPAGARALEPCSPRADSCELLFVGNLSYEPNREGLDHFLRHIWPRVRSTIGNARLRIVGALLPDDARHRWEAAPGVVVEGWVEDLRAAYDGAAMTIAPIYWGGGTKIKVLESLAFGRTCVLTPHALRGFGDVVRHNESLWCARDEVAFADGCIQLLVDPLRRQALAAHGQRVVNQHFNINRFTQVVAAAIERVGQSAARRSQSI